MPPAPTHAALCETPVRHLATAELLLMTTVRLFAAGALVDPRFDWREGFRTAGIGLAAIPAFQALFTIVSAAQKRSLDIRSLHAPNLGHDETCLLRMVGLAQRERLDEMRELLADWLHPAGVRLATGPVERLAEALRIGGFLLPVPGHAAQSFTAHADPGLMLVH